MATRSCISPSVHVLLIRLWEDEKGRRWAKSAKELDLEMLCVSQFTLYHVMKVTDKPYQQPIVYYIIWLSDRVTNPISTWPWEEKKVNSCMTNFWLDWEKGTRKIKSRQEYLGRWCRWVDQPEAHLMLYVSTRWSWSMMDRSPWNWRRCHQVRSLIPKKSHQLFLPLNRHSQCFLWSINVLLNSVLLLIYCVAVAEKQTRQCIVTPAEINMEEKES